MKQLTETEFRQIIADALANTLPNMKIFELEDADYVKMDTAGKLIVDLLKTNVP